ncbi:hypothetical protein RHOSPDRAFT_25524 [Rhodotorula sp. JG-1b]|nr:hypothetical protein RHOSPDRAFT_25524 [Rhodotorula sp. JG-1b]
MPTSRASLGRMSSNVTSYAESPSSDDEFDATTRPAKRARAASAEDSDDDEADYDPSREAKNKTKKAKQARKSEAKPNGIDRFSTLPLDALFESCTTPQFITDFYVLRRHCRKCRKETMFRLTRLKKNDPHSHPCTKLCVLESHCKFSRQPGRLTYEVNTRHAFRADYETLDKYLWSLQAQDDADSSSRPAGSQTVARKTTIKKGQDAPSPGPRVAKFVKERQQIKKLVKQVGGTARLPSAKKTGAHSSRSMLCRMRKLYTQLF